MPLFKFQKYDPVISIHQTRNDEFSDFTNYTDKALITDEETFGAGAEAKKHPMSGEVYLQSRKIENREERKKFILDCLNQKSANHVDPSSYHARDYFEKNQLKLPANWNGEDSPPALKYQVQLEIIRKKCEQVSGFRDKLLATRDVPIFEDTSGIPYYDNEFGMGPTGTGKNYLGLALMTVRAELLELEDPEKVAREFNQKARAVAKEIIPLKKEDTAVPYQPGNHLKESHPHYGKTFYKRQEINDFKNSDFKILGLGDYKKPLGPDGGIEKKLTAVYERKLADSKADNVPVDLFPDQKTLDLRTDDVKAPGYKRVLSELQKLADEPESDKNEVTFHLRKDDEYPYIVTLKEIDPTPNTSVTVDNEFLEGMKKQKDCPQNSNDVGMVKEYLRESSLQYLTALKAANNNVFVDVFAYRQPGEPQWYFDIKKEALEVAKKTLNPVPLTAEPAEDDAEDDAEFGVQHPEEGEPPEDEVDPLTIKHQAKLH